MKSNKKSGVLCWVYLSFNLIPAKNNEIITHYNIMEDYVLILATWNSPMSALAFREYVSKWCHCNLSRIHILML